MEITKAQRYAVQMFRDADSITIGKQYYLNNTDIKHTGVVAKSEGADSVFRQADNRISHNFHQILVDEKISYMFTYPILIDVDGNRAVNAKVDEILGADFTKKMSNLGIEASNVGSAWIHYWADEEGFKYGQIPTEQIHAFYSNDLNRKLTEVLRVYKVVEHDERLNPTNYYVIEDWTETTFDKYVFKDHIDGPRVNSDDKTILHNFGKVPFIQFSNNSQKTSDLDKYKDLVDLYDRVMSGYANDIEDIQQVIFVLRGYGGTKLNKLIEGLKRDKAIKLDSDESGNAGGLDTLTIEIPVEARNSILEILKKQIYESGQGLQQDSESFGNASGVALKFFYRKLELKSGLMETEFRKGLDMLIRAILDFYHISYSDITQDWTRNMISVDIEDAQIAVQSSGILPRKLILRNHPWVRDVDEAEKLLDKEAQDNVNMFNSYQFGDVDDNN